MKTTNYVRTGSTKSLPVSFIVVVFAILAAWVAVNLIFIGEAWLDQFNMICGIGGPMAIGTLLLLYLFNPAVRKLLTTNTVEVLPLSSGYQSIGRKRVPLSAVRPEIYGESYNAKVSTKSTNTRLQIVPLWVGHAVDLFLGLSIGLMLILTATVKSVSADNPEFSALLPDNSILQFFAIIPSGFKFFIALFGVICLLITGNALRKPQREIIFERSGYSCTIANVWLFGRIKRTVESIDLADVSALQVTSYTDKEAATRYTKQTGKKRGFTSKHSTTEYELNLVKKDGSRVNIVNHRYKKGVLKVTSRLHDWLGVPVTGQI